MASKQMLTVKKMVLEINLKHYIKQWAATREISLRKLSVEMGMSHMFMYNKCESGDLTGAEMLLLGKHLDVNPFELYINKLPEYLRPTKAEKELKTEIEELKKRLAEVEKERDWLKEVVGRK